MIFAAIINFTNQHTGNWIGSKEEEEKAAVEEMRIKYCARAKFY